MENKTFEIYMDFTRDSALLEVSVDVHRNEWAINYIYNLETSKYEETMTWTDKERKLLEAKIDEHINNDDVMSELNFNN